MLKLNFVLGSLLLTSVVSLPAFGDILYQTATNGGVDAGSGIAIEAVQFVGSRFTLGLSADITNITIEAGICPPNQVLGNVDSFFMTIIALPDIVFL